MAHWNMTVAYVYGRSLTCFESGPSHDETGFSQSWLLRIKASVDVIVLAKIQARKPGRLRLHIGDTRLRFRFCVLQALAVVALTAQETERFEVISIRPHPEPIGLVRDSVEGIRYVAEGRSLLSLIEDAYSMQRFQISGGPGWLTSAYFDVDARASGNQPLSWERARPMLKSMLAERFQLKVQHAMREVPCYDLVIASGGSKLRESADGGPASGVAVSADPTGVHVRAASATMVRLATNIAVYAGRPIVDKTGLRGRYRIELDYASESSQDAVNGTLATLFTALQEQLGLKLVPSHTTMDTLVIQSVEKPSEN